MPGPWIPPLAQTAPQRYDARWGENVVRTLNEFIQQFTKGDIEARSQLISDFGRIIGLPARITVGTYQILVSDDVVDVNFAGAVTLTLARAPIKGQRFIIQDSSGAACVNNITINPPPGITLNGSSSGIAIASDYGRALVIYNGLEYILAGLPAASVAVPVENRYDIALYRPGIYTSSQRVIKIQNVRASTFPIGLTASSARLDTSATNQTDFDLQKSGVSFGTCRIAAGAVVGTFISAAGVTFAADDRYEVFGPATADVSAAGLSITLKGTVG